MKRINIYEISEEQFNKTEYRPLDIEITSIEAEDEWDVQDVIENESIALVDKVIECSDLMVFKVYDYDQTCYIVQLKD